MNNFDLVTNFPKRNLSEISDDVTLEFAGIHTRETLYVQRKQNSF